MLVVSVFLIKDMYKKVIILFRSGRKCFLSKVNGVNKVNEKLKIVVNL